MHVSRSWSKGQLNPSFMSTFLSQEFSLGMARQSNEEPALFRRNTEFQQSKILKWYRSHSPALASQSKHVQHICMYQGWNIFHIWKKLSYNQDKKKKVSNNYYFFTQVHSCAPFCRFLIQSISWSNEMANICYVYTDLVNERKILL